MIERRYPSVPRLAPEGRTYICDQCDQEWRPGEGPICIECAVAWVEIESGLREPWWAIEQQDER